MNMRAGIWALGLVGSVAAHAGILALLMITVRPDPITKQPMPASELEVQAYQLDRTEAHEQRPETQQANANTPDGTALDAGAIPQSRARPAQISAKTLTPHAPGTEPARPAPTPPTPVAEAQKTAANISQVIPAPARLAALQRLQPTIKAAQSAPQALVPSAPPPTTAIAAFSGAAMQADPVLPKALPVTAIVQAGDVITPIAAVMRTEPAIAAILPAVIGAPTAVPRPAALPLAIARPNPVASTTPAPQIAPPQRVDAPSVRPATPSAQKLKAALAFSGGDGDVDPVSIAAFQSFMQPGDVVASGDQLRDGVAGLLAQVPCSRMQVAFDPDTATLQVNGHIPDDDLRAPVLAALRAQMGANITVSDNILILPRPQCGALSGIAGVGLAQSTDQITNPLVIGKDAHARVFSFTQGKLLSLDMTAPDYDAYIYLDYFDADGNVLHVEPNDHAPLRLATAQTAQQIGARTMQDNGLKLIIGPPYGQEIAVAFAASEPLYDGLRPIQEPAAGYLEWLKGRVDLARETHPDFKGEWVYFFVSTAER